VQCYSVTMVQLFIRVFMIITVCTTSETRVYLLGYNTISLLEIYWHFRGTYCPHFQGWRWRRYVPLKRWLIFNRLHTVIPHKTLFNSCISWNTSASLLSWMQIYLQDETDIPHLFFNLQNNYSEALNVSSHLAMYFFKLNCIIFQNYHTFRPSFILPL
jgi:hypothetical protein